MGVVRILDTVSGDVRPVVPVVRVRCVSLVCGDLFEYPVVVLPLDDVIKKEFALDMEVLLVRRKVVAGVLEYTVVAW